MVYFTGRQDKILLAFFQTFSIIITDGRGAMPGSAYNIIRMQSRFVRVKCRLNRELSAGRKEIAWRIQKDSCGAQIASRCNKRVIS